MVWEFEYAGGRHLLHHDIEPMPNGNVLICSGANGPLLEVTSDNAVVWEYVNRSSE